MRIAAACLVVAGLFADLWADRTRRRNFDEAMDGWHECIGELTTATELAKSAQKIAMACIRDDMRTNWVER